MYKVMIVEDEPPLLRDIKLEIERASLSFKVTQEAINGQDALFKLEEDLPDVIFTDIRMPVMDGLQLAKEVRKSHENIPIIFISGYQDFTYAQNALKLNVYDYIVKPISSDSLRELLQKLERRLERERQNMHKEILSAVMSNTPYPPLKAADIIKKQLLYNFTFTVGYAHQ